MMHITFQLSNGKRPSNFSKKSEELSYNTPQKLTQHLPFEKKNNPSSNPPPTVLQVPTVSFQGMGLYKVFPPYGPPSHPGERIPLEHRIEVAPFQSLATRPSLDNLLKKNTKMLPPER